MKPVEIESINDEMRTLLRSWVACMQKPRRKDWERIADNVCKDTVLLLGEMSRREMIEEANHEAVTTTEHTGD